MYLIPNFLQNEELSPNEANAILMTESELHWFGEDPNEVHNIRFIRIAHLYVKMLVLVSRCLEICGLGEMNVSDYL